MKIPMTIRTLASELRYAEDKQRGLTHEIRDIPTLRRWEHWRLIHNEYPYDLAFEIHHMLVPVRPVPDFATLDAAQLAELLGIIQELQGHADYDLMMWNFPKRQTIRNHFHLHLCKYHPDRQHMHNEWDVNEKPVWEKVR